jgi:hypothetical protein
MTFERFPHGSTHPQGQETMPCDQTCSHVSEFALRYWEGFGLIYPLADSILCLRQWMLL